MTVVIALLLDALLLILGRLLMPWSRVSVVPQRVGVR
jgi:hypothetical protein